MTPFRIEIEPGIPISEQIVLAAKRAILSGQMVPGDAFPSVRTLSKELRINPNTAHRAIIELVDAGLLVMHPGIGTVVATRPTVSVRDRTRLLSRQVEQLVVEACSLGVEQQELIGLVTKEYERLNPRYGGQATR